LSNSVLHADISVQGMGEQGTDKIEYSVSLLCKVS